MPSISIFCGVLLCLIGVIGYVFGHINNAASITALIPAFFGIVLIILGFLAKSNENLRKHLMHGAVVIGLLGFILPLGRIVSKMSEFTVSAASLSQIAMSLICLVFVILSIKSFIDARKS